MTRASWIPFHVPGKGNGRRDTYRVSEAISENWSDVRPERQTRSSTEQIGRTGPWINTSGKARRIQAMSVLTGEEALIRQEWVYTSLPVRHLWRQTRAIWAGAQRKSQPAGQGCFQTVVLRTVLAKAGKIGAFHGILSKGTSQVWDTDCQPWNTALSLESDS